MPELFRLFGIRFFFCSNEHPPVHVHVRNGDRNAKFEVNPVKLIENNGIKSKDSKIAEGIEENEDLIINRWYEYFK